MLILSAQLMRASLPVETSSIQELMQNMMAAVDLVREMTSVFDQIEAPKRLSSVSWVAFGIAPLRFGRMSGRKSRNSELSGA
jgi:hypothetical protein